MVWAQLTSRRSLRDIETSLRAHSDKLYRMGIGTGVSRNNLASTVTGHEERDQTFMEDYTYERGCFYIFDKMYFKTRGLFRVEDSGAYFVTRIKRNAVYRVTESRPVSGTLVLADRTIEFTNLMSVSLTERRWLDDLVNGYCPQESSDKPVQLSIFDSDILLQLERE